MEIDSKSIKVVSMFIEADLKSIRFESKSMKVDSNKLEYISSNSIQVDWKPIEVHPNQWMSIQINARWRKIN